MPITLCQPAQGTRQPSQRLEGIILHEACSLEGRNDDPLLGCPNLQIITCNCDSQRTISNSQFRNWHLCISTSVQLKAFQRTATRPHHPKVGSSGYVAICSLSTWSPYLAGLLSLVAFVTEHRTTQPRRADLSTESTGLVSRISVVLGAHLLARGKMRCSMGRWE